MEDEYKLTFENDLVQIKIKKWTRSTRKMAKSIAGWIYNETKEPKEKKQKPTMIKGHFDKNNKIVPPKKIIEKKPKKVNNAETIGKDIYRVALKNAWILGKKISIEAISEKLEKDEDEIISGLSYLINERKAAQSHNKTIQFY